MKTSILMTWLLIGASVSISSGQMTPRLIVANKSSHKVQIIAIDSGTRSDLPANVESLFDRLPPGSFLLKNKTPEPITAIVTTWDYVDTAGLPQQIRLNCDAYLLAPLDPIVDPNQDALISPYACASHRVFDLLEAGTVMGSPLGPGLRGFSPDLRSPIHVYVDSIVFQNGDIWGPDNLHYYTVILERHSTIEEFVSEVMTSKGGTSDLRSTSKQIENDASGKHDKAQSRRAYYARLLRISPNPEATLEQLRNHPHPPSFRHIGEL